MELVLPKNYVEVTEEEMMYLDGGGWIANTCAVGGAIVGSLAWGIRAAAAGALLGTITLPIIGTVSVATLAGVAGVAFGYISGTVTGYNFGRLIETRVLGWK